MRAEAEAIKVKNKSEAYKVSQEMIADTQARKIRDNAESRLAVAQARSAALIKESTAESSNSNKMEGMRRHIEKMALTSGYAESSKDMRMVITGKQGEDFLKYFVNTANQVEQR